MASVEAPCTPADTGCQPSTSGVKTSKTVAPNDVHILLVDDERLSRVVVGNLLRKCSYKGVPRCPAYLGGSFQPDLTLNVNSHHSEVSNYQNVVYRALKPIIQESFLFHTCSDRGWERNGSAGNLERTASRDVQPGVDGEMWSCFCLTTKTSCLPRLCFRCLSSLCSVPGRDDAGCGRHRTPQACQG